MQNQRAELLQEPNLELNFKEAFLSQDFTPSAWSYEKWWEMFNDPQLSQFIELSIKNSPTLAVAEERVLAAHQVSKLQFSPLLPEADLALKEALIDFSYRRRGLEFGEPILPSTILPNWLNFFTTLVNFKWDLDLFGKQKKLYRAAIDEIQMALAEAAEQKLLISIQVARCYFELQYHINLEQQLLDQWDLLVEKQILLQRQLECGLGTQMMLDEHQMQMLQLEKQLSQCQKDLSLGLSQLGVFVSLDPANPTPMQMPTASFDRPFPLPASLNIDLLSKRADIVSHLWAIQAAIKRVNAAKVSFLPSIDLGSLSGYFTLTYKEIMKPRAWFTSVIPGATLPIFHGLALRSKLNYSVREYNMAVGRYNDALVKAAQEVVDGITSFKFTQESLSYQKALLYSCENLSLLTSLKFQYGLATQYEQIDRQLKLNQESIHYSELVQLRLLATLQLIKSLGGGYENTEAQKDLNQEFIYE